MTLGGQVQKELKNGDKVFTIWKKFVDQKEVVLTLLIVIPDGLLKLINVFQVKHIMEEERNN